jgi:hypothetical protein
MRRSTLFAVLCSGLALAAGNADGQSLARRVTSSDGRVQVIYASRPSACGDGEAFIGNVFGHSTYYSGNSTFSGHGSWSSRPCVHGPARVVATVISGEVTRLRPYVGPTPATSDMRTLNASPAEAVEWLDDLIARGSSRLASEAMLPLVLADAPDPWPFLLRVARDANRPNAVRRSALTWLSTGVTDKLGISDEDGDSDDDEVRKQAVFALSQRPKSESVPELISIVRSSKNAAARRSAIFWLGQTGDPRAAELYAELLNAR